MRRVSAERFPIRSGACPVPIGEDSVNAQRKQSFRLGQIDELALSGATPMA